MINGILLVDKEVGITSYDVIRRIKKNYPKGTKIGHTGTLDPFASGLLILLIGRSATKLMEKFHNLEKEYVVDAQFGFETDTQDITGETVLKDDKLSKIPRRKIMKKLLYRAAKFFIIPISILVLFLTFSFIPSDVQAEGEIEIYTLEDLDAVRNDLTASYILMNNLDFNNDSDYENIANKTTWTTGDGWTPIGTYSAPFSGTFDGQEYTISNLLIDTPTDIYDVGLFGANTGTIQNLEILDSLITGHDNPSPTPGEFTGILVGYSTGDITNCGSTGVVSTDGNHAGGLIGYQEVGTVSDSYSEASVTYTGANYKDGFGGLIGKIYGGATIDNSYATGLVSESASAHTGTSAGGLSGVSEGSCTISNSYATGDVEGFYGYVGGLVGYNYNSDISTSYATGSVEGLDNIGGLAGYHYKHTITNSYATGNVIGLTEKIGGLLGYAYETTITNCFAHGTVEGDDSTGGLIGYISATSNGSHLTNCYASGTVSENDNTVPGGDGGDIGAFIGYALGYTYVDNSYATGYITSSGLYDDDVAGFIGDTNSPFMTNSFWDTESTGRAESFGVTGKTTAEMKSISTFNDTATEGLDTAWSIVLIDDFDPEGSDIWYIDDGNDYPRLFLEYEEPSEPPVIVVEIDPTVTGETSSSVTTKSSTLEATISDMGSHNSVDVYFQYKKSESSTWIDTSKQTKTAVGKFTHKLENLDPNTGYDFRSIIEFGVDGKTYSTVKSFTTTKVILPKVRITDIGLISWVLDLDDMLYYFTSETARIKGTSYKNSHVKFVTEDEEFETDADINGDFNITLELPRGTNEIEYYAYNDFGSESETRILTLVIGEENFPSNENEDEETIEDEDAPEEIIDENNEDSQTDENQDEETTTQTITFTDENGDPLSSATIEIDGKTYTTNENGEIEADILSEGIHTAKITYNGKTYTKEILATKSAHIEVVIEVGKADTNWKTILTISGITLLFLILIIIFFKRRKEEEENSNYTN